MLRAPGLFDCSGTIKGFVDTSQPIETNVQEGTVGVIKMYRNATQFFSFTCIIDSIKIDTGVDQVETWDMAFSLQSGPVTRPVPGT
jgi:trehalose/maltose hydrolase-like predicted phosphorylase